MAQETTQDTTLVIERVLPANREAVYEAWTNPEVLLKWWGPQGCTIPVHELDVRPGGNWTTTMHSDQMGKNTVSGKYISLDPPKGLVFTWAWSDDKGNRGHETEVEVSLETVTSGTKMIMTQKIFENAKQRDNHNFGWVSSFEKISAAIAQSVPA